LLIVFGINGSLIKFVLCIMDCVKHKKKKVSFLACYIKNHSCETSNLHPRDSPTPPATRAYSLFLAFFFSLFFVYILKPTAFFFHAVAGNPSRGLLTRIGDRSPFEATTWEKRRTRVPLVFHVEAAARASSPIRGTFSANRLENFAVSDVCNWQIILMVILDETCHCQPHEYRS